MVRLAQPRPSSGAASPATQLRHGAAMPVMLFFGKRAHQNSASVADAPRYSFSATLIHAEDADEFVGMLRGYRLRLMQIDKGPFVADAVQTRLAGTLLSAAQYSRALVHSGEPPRDKITFAMGTARVPALWLDQQFEADDLLIVTSGTEIDLVSQPGYGLATASFPLELVQETLDHLGWTRLARSPRSLVAGLEQSKAAMLRATFGAILREAAMRPFNEQATRRARSKSEHLLYGLLECAAAPLPATRSVGNGERARVLKAALAAIHDRPEDVLTVADLCRIARTGERTLHYAFTERFRLPPAHYMKAWRLNRVRDDLCREQNPKQRFPTSQTNGVFGTWVNLPGTTDDGFWNCLRTPTKENTAQMRAVRNNNIGLT